MMEQLESHVLYGTRLGGRRNPFTKGVYLGHEKGQRRILVRADGGTPRVYHFRRYELDGATLIIRYPRIAELKDLELEFAERILESKGI